MKNILVIHHSADFDGLFCREIAKHFIGVSADYLGWDYGDPIPVVGPEVSRIFMLDISVDGMMGDSRLVWIDHHKSAMEKFNPAIPGYRIDGVAACRLAWQWFTTIANSTPQGILIPKQDFIDRKVSEPLSVRLAGEYDIWDRRDPNAELFQHGLRSRDLTGEIWSRLFETGRRPTIKELEIEQDLGIPIEILPDGTVFPTQVAALLASGRVLQYAKTKENESVAKQLAFTIQFEGLCFCAINAARYNSHLFTAGIKPEHDALFGFNFDGKQWRVSLYHAPGKEHHDLSKIAVKYGGGGHRGACGFKALKLPFLP